MATQLGNNKHFTKRINIIKTVNLLYTNCLINTDKFQKTKILFPSEIPWYPGNDEVKCDTHNNNNMRIQCFPGNIGRLLSISANMHPTDHISTVDAKQTHDNCNTYIFPP